MHKKYFLFFAICILAQLNFSSDRERSFHGTLSESSANFGDMLKIAEIAAALVANKNQATAIAQAPTQQEKTGRSAHVVTIVIPSIEVTQNLYRKSPERLDKNFARQTTERGTSSRSRTLQGVTPHFMKPTLSSRARTEQDLNQIGCSLLTVRGGRSFFPIVQTRGSVGGVRGALCEI